MFKEFNLPEHTFFLVGQKLLSGVEQAMRRR